jgi:putative SOS response-associated peptidase YedK
MCGRFTATAAFDVLAERFGITVEEGTHEELIARYNVAPSQAIPIVVNRWTRIPPMIARGRQLILAKWGFRPAWVKHGTLAPINARAETVAMSRLFGWALRDGRCIIPATGFYEWKPLPGQTRKQPYHVRLKGGEPFGFAGLWTPGATSEIPPTCAVITTTANGLLAPIHDRMPVILDPDDEKLWLDPDPVAPLKLLPCLRPFPADRMEAFPVSSRVSSPGNEGRELLERVPVEDG